MAIFARVISPKPIRSKPMRAELLAEQKAIGKLVKKDFEATVATWEHKPRFTYQLSLARGEAVLFVGPAGSSSKAEQVYEWVDKGTRKHLIRPRKPGGSLRFKGTYKAKSMPGVIGSRPGGASGKDVYAKLVRHPGTEARRFDREIGKKWRKEYRKRMDSAMKAAVAVSGHKL